MATARKKYYAVAIKVNNVDEKIVYSADKMAHVRSAIINQLVTIEQIETSDLLVYIGAGGKILDAAADEGEGNGSSNSGE